MPKFGRTHNDTRMTRKLIYVFHNGHKRGTVTRDCRLRMEAARSLASGNPDALVFFVGGNGISGGKDMEKYWVSGRPELPNVPRLLDQANNTADAVLEIIQSVKENGNGRETVLISSAYHVGRISFFAHRNGLDADIVSAEGLLEHSETFVSEVRRYRNSFTYRLKIAADRLILVYAYLFDRGQVSVRFWRRLSRALK